MCDSSKNYIELWPVGIRRATGYGRIGRLSCRFSSYLWFSGPFKNPETQACLDLIRPIERYLPTVATDVKFQHPMWHLVRLSLPSRISTFSSHFQCPPSTPLSNCSEFPSNTVTPFKNFPWCEYMLPKTLSASASTATLTTNSHNQPRANALIRPPSPGCSCLCVHRSWTHSVPRKLISAQEIQDSVL